MTGFSTKMKLLCTNFFVPKKENLDMNQVRLLRCGILPTSSLGFVAFLGSPGGSSPPGFLFLCGCCSESEDSAIYNLRIQHSNSLCGLMSLLFFSCSLSSSQDLMHCTLCLTVCTCTPCQRASFNSTIDSFSWGHDPYTLACEARPSFDGCGTSLSVSQCQCQCQSST